MRAGAGAALHAIDVDAVRSGLGRHANVVVDARRAQLELDRNLPVGRFTDFLDLEGQIVGTQPVRMPSRGALIDAGRQRTHLRDLIGDLLTHQMTAQAHLAPLADEELTGVGEHQVVRIEPVPALDQLVVPLRRVVALGRDHAAFAGAGCGARHGGAAGEGDLRLVAQRTKAHAGDVDRNVEHQGSLGARSDHGARFALFPIALDDEARQRAGQESQIVPARDLLEQREAAHAIAAELALDVDIVDDFGREERAVAEHMRVAAELVLGRR